MADKEHEAVEGAIKLLIDSPFTSYNAAAAVYRVPPTTLRRRFNQGLSRRESHSNQQLLAPEQEDQLVQWILDLEKQGHAPTHKQAREMAQYISISSGGPKSVGLKWIYRFLKRHAAIGTKIGRRMDALRIQNTNPEDLRAWYDLVKQNIVDFRVDPANIWNMDETGLSVGACSNGRVIGSSATKRTYKKVPSESRERVTILETISAEGEFIRPLVIFKGKELQTSWFQHDSVPDWRYITSENAFTSNSIGLNWLKLIFLPETARIPPLPRLLLLDGHGSHISTDFLWECRQHQVYVIFMVPHTSHVCQPLDLCPFSVIKLKYRVEIQELSRFDNADKVKKIRFVEFYHRARREALTATTIKAGWKATGLHPWNPNKALNSSLILQAQNTTQLAPKSPSPPSELIISTPHNRRQLRISIDALAANEDLSRPVRMLFNKAAKGFDKLHFTEAENTLRLRGQQQKLDEIQTKKRKKITIGPQEAFADIETIKKAKVIADRESERAEVYQRRQGAAMARATANQMIQRDMEAFCSVFALETHAERTAL